MLRLIQIELLGFKSFPHKTVVDIDRGVTCIVGPNGSGKSNIADAIQFAFGSQSGHELRTKRVAGLIFAGTDQLRPLNLASVTMHFERTLTDLPDPEDSFNPLSQLDEEELDLLELASASQPVGSQLLDRSGLKGTELTNHVPALVHQEIDRTPGVIKQLNELQPGDRISVTRRIFRDGTGGYFVNGEQVRLKDIDTLFNRFHLGRAGVFSVTQGEVEKKILATPQEMREWLAEATGVALLLQQKTRAASKLRRTAQNLERLEDIRINTRELVADLAVQRERAEKYQRLSAQLRAVELNEIRREVEFAQRQQESSASALQDLALRLAEANTNLDGQRDKASRDQQARAETERQLEQAEQELAAGREKIAQLRQEAAVALRAATGSTDAINRAKLDEQELKGQLSELEQELADNASAVKTAQVERDSAAQLVQTAKNELLSARQRLARVADEQSEVSKAAFNLAQQATQLANDMTMLQQARERLGSQLENRSAQLAAATERLAEAADELQAEQAKVEQLALDAGLERDKLEQHKAEIEQCLERIGAAEEKCAVLRDRQAQLDSRRKTIDELADQAEDPAGGTAMLLSSAKLAGRLNRATELTFPADLRPAFTRLLAHLGDAVIGEVKIRGTAQSALAGQPTDALLLSPLPTGELHPDSLWRQAEAPQPVLAALVAKLGDVLPADSLAAAEALLEREQRIAAVVLRDGSALVGRGHAYLGAPAPERALKVARRSDMAGIEAELGTAAVELKQAEQQLAEAKGELSRLQWERDETSAKLAAAQERTKNALELSDRLHKAHEERQAELELLQHQAGQLERDRRQVEDELPLKEQQRAENAETRRQTDERADRIAKAHLAAGAEVEDARAELTRNTTARELVQQRARHLEQAGLDLAERVNNARLKLKQLAERIAAIETEKRQNEKLAAESAGRADGYEVELSRAGERLEDLRRRRQALGEEADKRQLELTQLAQELARLEQDEVSQRSINERATEKITQWLGELKQRFDLTLSELVADPAVAAPPPDAALDAAEAGRGKLREERARLAAGLAELGAVNLLAIEQHQEHSARLTFLDGQAEELNRAAADLSQLVEDLDRNTEKQYRANLRRIETRFNEIYLSLFGSGWARLRFENPEEIINSGVEVEVQLPASRRHSLRSLSGGQRSLIFLALFFAVHHVRSPGFCILDEADAALDDANVERFVKIIKSFAAEEQFILITHNKQTMETADKLIGVVGRPKGVSNLLEVDLKAARKMVDTSKGVA